MEQFTAIPESKNPDPLDKPLTVTDALKQLRRAATAAGLVMDCRYGNGKYDSVYDIQLIKAEKEAAL